MSLTPPVTNVSWILLIRSCKFPRQPVLENISFEGVSSFDVLAKPLESVVRALKRIAMSFNTNFNSIALLSLCGVEISQTADQVSRQHMSIYISARQSSKFISPNYCWKLLRRGL